MKKASGWGLLVVLVGWMVGHSALAAPVGPLTYLTNTVRTAGSITLAWTNIASDGDAPTGAIVFARSGTSQTSPFSPVDDTGYSENANYSMATAYGSGWRCVSHQDGIDEVTVSGLSANTTYTFLAYPWDGDVWGAVDFLTGTPKFLQARTLSSEPAVAASSISFSAVNNSSMTVGWTRGDGASVLVVVRAGAVPVNPVDGVVYTADAAFGSGTDLGSSSFVVYKGTGTSVNLTGLSANTSYTVALFEFNGSSSGENYLVTGRPTASRSTTIAAPVTSASSVAFSSVGANQMTVGWVNGNGSRRLVLMRDGAITSDPVSGTNYSASATYGNGASFGDGSFAVFDGVNGPVTVSGLNPSTTYTVEVFEYNGTGESTSYMLATPGAGSQSTLSTEPTAQATFVSFSAIATNGMTVSWVNGNGANRIVVMREDYAVDGNPVDGVAYALDDSLGGGTVVYSGASTNAVLDDLVAGKLYHFRVYEFNGAASSCNYLTATATDNPDSQRTLLAPPALDPASAVTGTGFTVSWLASLNASGYRLDVSTNSNCVGGYVGSYSDFDISSSGNNLQHAVTGLQPGTLYYFRVKAYASGSTSVYSSIVSAWTLAAAPTALNATNATAVSFHANWLSVASATGYRLDVATDESFASMVAGFSDLDVGTALTRLVTGLSAAQTYYYRVRAVNSSGASANSGTTVATTVPAAPLALSGAYLNTNSFQAFWVQAEGATGYRLDVSTNQDFSNFVTGFSNLNVGLVTTHTVLHTDLRAGVTNYYRVRAYNASGTSTNSNIETASYSTAVVLYYFDLMRCGQDVKVVWETASEESTVGFYVQRLNSDSTWTQIHDVLVPASGVDGMGARYSIVDPGAVPGQSYIYRLTEVETDGDRIEYGPYLRNTDEFRIPEPVSFTEDGAVIQWLSSAAESYSILRSTNLVEGFTVVATGLPGEPPMNSYTDTGLTAGTVFYKIVADAIDGK